MEKHQPGNLIISSPAFREGENIPSKYTCEGEGINPPLKVENIPDGTQSLAIIAEDPDATGGTFDHWIVWNIPPHSTIIENRIPGISGKNSTGKTGYHGPCPPSGTHRYFFYVFALDQNLDLDAGSNKESLRIAMKSNILDHGKIMGRYKNSAL